jgi:30S ribosomal protein S31
MGKGDKKTKRGKIIIGSFGVRRPSRKMKAGVPVVKIAEEKPKKAPKVAEEPVVISVVAVEQAEAEVKKPVKKAPAKKVAAEEEPAKPKATKSKKKAAPEGETLFTQPEPPTPEQ